MFLKKNSEVSNFQQKKPVQNMKFYTLDTDPYYPTSYMVNDALEGP